MTKSAAPSRSQLGAVRNVRFQPLYNPMPSQLPVPPCTPLYPPVPSSGVRPQYQSTWRVCGSCEGCEGARDSCVFFFVYFALETLVQRARVREPISGGTRACSRCGSQSQGGRREALFECLWLKLSSCS
eukprot:2314862-Pyramimonas_sp.AAC.1